MPREPLPTERTLLQGIAVARWGTWVWLAATTLLQHRDLAHPVGACVAVAAALAWAVVTTVALRARPGVLLLRSWASAELALGWALLAADGMVFVAGHTDGGGQNLAGTWPLVAILVASTSLVPWVACAGAVVVATGRLLGALANGEPAPTGGRLVSFAATAAFYGVAALVWSWVSARLRVVETEVLARRARDDVARTLHDGVLQTLALVARRTAVADPELAAVARTSDRELRTWLRHGTDREPTGIDALVRDAVARAVRGDDLAVTVNVVAEREPRVEVARALAGAVGEAVVNTVRHAGASRAVVFVEVDDDGAAFASVRDDGRGFEPATARAAGRGIVHSIDERLGAVGGRTEIASAPGAGSEVRLWAT